ncbi:hypothetical protein [Chromobacterium haemolyticum]|uniref:HK97 gp10 family phage protein n=1 Tax=Chromobacterium haemolyticum TaxID=394935 RepID=A0A1W0D5P0_9NEIS|nr:hypothetical protein [Chromobacterium haemolyticum]OQS42337.1 hypothetical protein B0T45_05995 [Chromobacterium haemolyticum]
MEFSSLGELALHLAAVSAAHQQHMHEGLEKCAKRIEETAKAEIGTYQSAVGPFPAWDPLADSTEQQKAQKGYPADSPLLASGDMRDSIEHVVRGHEAVIGAKDKKMVYHEFGTNKIPPRPVFGPALFRNKEFILRTIGRAAVSGLVGGQNIVPGLGYDGE